MQITTHQAPIIIADSPPTMTPEIAGKWLSTSTGEYFYRWFDTRSASWFTYNGSEWVPVGDGNLDIPGTLNTETGFRSGGDLGVDGLVEMARFGGGKITLTFNKGIVTEIESEA